MQFFITILHVMLCFTLILIILLQPMKPCIACQRCQSWSIDATGRATAEEAGKG